METLILMFAIATATASNLQENRELDTINNRESSHLTNVSWASRCGIGFCFLNDVCCGKQICCPYGTVCCEGGKHCCTIYSLGNKLWSKKRRKELELSNLTEQL